MFYTDPVTELKTISDSIIMWDPNESGRDSEGLSAHLKRTVVICMSICRPQAFQHGWTVYLYTFIWIEAKKCVVFQSLNGFPIGYVVLA